MKILTEEERRLLTSLHIHLLDLGQSSTMDDALERLNDIIIDDTRASLRSALRKLEHADLSEEERIKQRVSVPMMICYGLTATTEKTFLKMWLITALQTAKRLEERKAPAFYTHQLGRFIRQISNHPERYQSLIAALDGPNIDPLQTTEKIERIYAEWSGLRIRQTAYIDPYCYRRLYELRQSLIRAYRPRSQTSGNHQQIDTDGYTAIEDNVVDGDIDDDVLERWINTRGSLSHIARRDHHLPNDPAFFAKNDIRKISIRLNKLAHQGSLEASMLYLILITGESFDTWVQICEDKHEKLKIVQTRHDQIMYLTRQPEMPNKVPPAKEIEPLFISSNKTKSGIPIPKAVYERVSNNLVRLTEATLEDYLKTECNDVPRCTLARLKKTLYFVLKRHIADRYIADLVCGTSLKRSPAINYSSYSYLELYQSYRKAILWMHDERVDLCTFLLSPRVEKGDVRIGSNTLMKKDKAAALFKSLMENVEQQQSPINRMNAHTVWIWHVLLVLTSVRVVSDLPGLPKNMDYEAKLWWTSDKEPKNYSGSYGRIMPLCNTLIDALTDYEVHARQCLNSLKTSSKTLHQYNQHYLKGEFPIFVFFKPDCNLGWSAIPVTYEIILDYFRGTGFDELPKNWTRHFARRHLVDMSCPSYIIDALFGHEKAYAEFLNPNSSAGISELMSVGDWFDELAKSLEIRLPKWNLSL